MCTPDVFPSSAGHVESGVNSGGPPPKAKYSLATDRALVERLTNEQNPCSGSELESETVYLQAVEALCPQGNGCPRAFCMIRRVTLQCKVKSLRDVTVAKASVNSASSTAE
jgi:hypothetical protein